LPKSGYHYLTTYMLATVIFDLTVEFCDKFLLNREYLRIREQMFHAGRSGRQNIAEGYEEKSLQSYIKLLGVADASLEELLLDYQDFLRQRGLRLWAKDSEEAKAVRALAYKSDKSYETYMSYMTSPESAANCIICLIYQATYLLDKQLASLEKSFIEDGGYSESLFKRRLERRSKYVK